MAGSDWVFKLPKEQRAKLAKKTIACMKKLRIKPAAYRKLAKVSPKKAAELKRKFTACLFKKK